MVLKSTRNVKCNLLTSIILPISEYNCIFKFFFFIKTWTFLVINYQLWRDSHFTVIAFIKSSQLVQLKAPVMAEVDIWSQLVFTQRVKGQMPQRLILVTIPTYALSGTIPLRPKPRPGNRIKQPTRSRPSASSAFRLINISHSHLLPHRPNFSSYTSHILPREIHNERNIQSDSECDFITL